MSGEAMKGLVRSFRYAFNGMAYALATQRNMRVHFLAAFVVIFLCTVISINVLQITTVLFSIALVITLEMVNTAIEHVVDMVTSEFHPLAKVAKDVAAAAVLIAAANAVAVAYLVFYDKLNPIHWRTLRTLLQPPFIGVVLIGVLCLMVAVSGYAVHLRLRGKDVHTSG
ncbi:diacylglycerol kinase family protein [Sulfoacidibacillus thermotolerans]|uniref:diacylglycerol kinase family protein n=1 Tax=Sulfoacidibacillus thermotolerans TaxID=1765684 RepID=UPI0015E7E730|nr:diacylglycerol kinase family protein [Sulfoacidibacillus thermotolerans]